MYLRSSRKSVTELKLCSVRAAKHAMILSMRIQMLIIMVMVSLLAWGGSYRVVEKGYHIGQSVGAVPNLHIKHRVRKAAGYAWDAMTSD